MSRQYEPDTDIAMVRLRTISFHAKFPTACTVHVRYCSPPRPLFVSYSLRPCYQHVTHKTDCQKVYWRKCWASPIGAPGGHGQHQGSLQAASSHIQWGTAKCCGKHLSTLLIHGVVHSSISFVLSVMTVASLLSATNVLMPFAQDVLKSPMASLRRSPLTMCTLCAFSVTGYQIARLRRPHHML